MIMEEQDDAEPADAQLQSSAAAENQPGPPSDSNGHEDDDEAEEEEHATEVLDKSFSAMFHPVQQGTSQPS